MPRDPFETWQAELHGHEVIYRTVGEGPPIVIVHGMLNSSRHWRRVAIALAEGGHRVVVPDLIGHGDSATPRGDYSIGAHAAVIRDLLAALEVESATFVGHSLGGGIAMQFFYQFPDQVERLALVSSGGLGREVSPLLRAAALPGASALLWGAARPATLAALAAAAERLDASGRPGLAIQLRAIVRALGPLQARGSRAAFLQTLRSVIDVHGQHVSAIDRLYLLGPVPTLIVWGGRDGTIPAAHGQAAHEAIPHSQFEILERAAHFPNLEDPDGLARVVGRWIAETEPYRLTDEDWAELIASRTVRSRRLRAA